MFSSDPELPIGDLPNPPLLPTSCEPHCDGLESMRLPASLRTFAQPWPGGEHLLRNALATGMLRNGASLPEIGEILRHQLPKTTAIYTKVDTA